MQTNQTKTAKEAVGQLQAMLLDQLQPFLSSGTKFALLDFPNHSNIGDSAIWAGQLAIFRKLTGHLPSYVSTTDNFDPDEMRRTIHDGPIFLHGGGNFGDIYDRHQAFREHIFATYSDRQIIQLPQSITYQNSDGIDKTAKAIRGNSRITLMVRDRPSYDLCQQYFDCNLMLSPDGAFGLGPIARTSVPDKPLVMLMREDVERADWDIAELISVYGNCQLDWPRENRGKDIALKSKALLQASAKGDFSKSQMRTEYYNLLANERLNTGLQILSGGKMVITDRLHGHILSTLLDVPHIPLDNKHRKVHNFIDQWTYEVDCVEIDDGGMSLSQRVSKILSEVRPK